MRARAFRIGDGVVRWTYHADRTYTIDRGVILLYFARVDVLGGFAACSSYRCRLDQGPGGGWRAALLLYPTGPSVARAIGYGRTRDDAVIAAAAAERNAWTFAGDPTWFRGEE